MRSAQFVPYSFLLLAFARSNDSNEEANVAAGSSNENNDDADPFVSNSASEEKEINDNNLANLSEPTEGNKESAMSDDTSNLSSGKNLNATPGSLDAIAISEEKPADREPGVLTDNELFGIGNDKATPTTSSKYWTELVIDNKHKNVLVNIKTVTIIESMKTVETTDVKTATFSASISTSTSKASATPAGTTTSAKISTSTTTSASADAGSGFPYIKIQMPSSSSTSKTSTSSSVSKTATPKTHYKTVTRYERTGSSAKPTTASTTFASTVSKASVSTTSAKTKTSTTTGTAAKKTAKVKTTKPKTVPATTKTEDATFVGSIFNVLKNLPTGSSEASNVYIEGSFKFPKRKEVSDKIYKLSGYISRG